MNVANLFLFLRRPAIDPSPDSRHLQLFCAGKLSTASFMFLHRPTQFPSRCRDLETSRHYISQSENPQQKIFSPEWLSDHLLLSPARNSFSTATLSISSRLQRSASTLGNENFRPINFCSLVLLSYSIRRSHDPTLFLPDNASDHLSASTSQIVHTYVISSSDLLFHYIHPPGDQSLRSLYDLFSPPQLP